MPGVNRIDRERVRQLLRQGSTPKQVCLRLGINKDSVLRIAREAREGNCHGRQEENRHHGNRARTEGGG